MRRFFIGLISGGLVAVLGLVMVSQIAPPPGAVARAQPSAVGGVVNETAQSPNTTAALEGDLAADGSAAILPDPPAEAASAQAAHDDTTGKAGKPLTDVSGAASDAVPTDADTITAVQPTAPVDTPTPPATETAQNDEAADVPAPIVKAPAVAVVPVQPAAPPRALPPAAPLTDVPLLRHAPDAPDTAAVPAADSTASLGQTGPAAPAAPGADEPPALADLPPPPPLTPDEQVALAPVPAPDTVTVAIDDPAQPAPELPAPALPAPEPSETALPKAPPATPAPVAVAEPETSAIPDVDLAQIPEAIAPAVIDVDAGPSVFQPDTPLIESTPVLPATRSLGSAGEGVIVNRATGPDPVAESPVLPVADADAQPPVTRFAAAFENPDAKPLFSIVLIDTGEATLDRVAIAALPFAVSVAIDPLSADAAAHAALYRAGGKEVLMLASGIPAGASPSDLEQTFHALDAALPEAVAVVDTETSSFQDDRPLATQIVPILAAQGRGLLTWDRGLNAADQVARREGLASAMIFRRIDGAGETTPVIRRYLDRAAFKAAQEGRVTVIGEARAETIAALLEWTVEGRASGVAIAPVSAQLTAR